MANGRQDNEYLPIINALSREAGGCAKVVTISVFFDERGRLIGKSSTRVVTLHPSDIFNKLGVILDK